MNSQLIESNFLELDLELDLLPNDELDVSPSNHSEQSEPLESDVKLIDSTTDSNWFNDSEIETSLLYSDSMTLNHTSNESPGDNEPEISPEATDIPMEESEVPLTNTITVGNMGGTQFTFNFAEDTPQEVINGVQQAAENWSSVLKDDVDLTIDFTFMPAEPTNLGSAVPTFIPLPYADVNTALVEDVTSLNDNTAVANLPEDSIDILINNTSENNGSDTPFLDNNNGFNNSNVLLTNANAKALGIGLEDLAEVSGVTPEEFAELLNQQYPDFPIDANAADASLNFNSNITWDFDPSDGIAADATNFVGTVTHEIGHTLGFVSSADFLDIIAAPNLDLKDVIDSIASEEIKELIAGTNAEGIADGVALDQFISENEYLLQPLDLFRFTPESFEQGVRDFTTGNIEDKYFSIDGGETEILPLSEGANTATDISDRQQLSHWEDNLNIGIMDPTLFPGELAEISDNDLLAFDVIGWDVA